MSKMFISYDNEIFELNNSASKFSGMLNGFFENMMQDDTSGTLENPIVVPSVEMVPVSNFKLIIEFMNLMPGSRVFGEDYDYTQKPNKNVKLIDTETDFINRNFDTTVLIKPDPVPENYNPGLHRKEFYLKLWDLLVSADYMLVPTLCHVLYKTCADTLKGLETQQMRDMMGIVPFDDRFVTKKPEKYLIDPTGPNVPENRKNAPYGFTPEEEEELEKKLAWSKI